LRRTFEEKTVLQEEEEEKVEPQGRSDEPIIKDKSKGKKSKAAAKAGTGIVASKLSVFYCLHRILTWVYLKVDSQWPRYGLSGSVVVQV
jgi:hypothetical protein